MAAIEGPWQYLRQQEIALAGNIEHLFAVMMATIAPATATIKLWAKYDAEGEVECTREYLVDAEPRWYPLPIPKPVGASELEVRIYANPDVPVYLVDSLVVGGTRFPGAIPKPEHGAGLDPLAAVSDVAPDGGAEADVD